MRSRRAVVMRWMRSFVATMSDSSLSFLSSRWSRSGRAAARWGASGDGRRASRGARGRRRDVVRSDRRRRRRRRRRASKTIAVGEDRASRWPPPPPARRRRRRRSATGAVGRSSGAGGPRTSGGVVGASRARRSRSACGATPAAMPAAPARRCRSGAGGARAAAPGVRAERAPAAADVGWIGRVREQLERSARRRDGVACRPGPASSGRASARRRGRHGAAAAPEVSVGRRALGAGRASGRVVGGRSRVARPARVRSAGLAVLSAPGRPAAPVRGAGAGSAGGPGSAGGAGRTGPAPVRSASDRGRRRRIAGAGRVRRGARRRVGRARTSVGRRRVRAAAGSRRHSVARSRSPAALSGRGSVVAPARVGWRRRSCAARRRYAAGAVRRVGGSEPVAADRRARAPARASSSTSTRSSADDPTARTALERAAGGLDWRQSSMWRSASGLSAFVGSRRRALSVRPPRGDRIGPLADTWRSRGPSCHAGSSGTSTCPLPAHRARLRSDCRPVASAFSTPVDLSRAARQGRARHRRRERARPRDRPRARGGWRRGRDRRRRRDRRRASRRAGRRPLRRDRRLRPRGEPRDGRVRARTLRPARPRHLNAGVTSGCGLGEDFDLARLPPRDGRQPRRRRLRHARRAARCAATTAPPRGAIVATASLAGLTAVPMEPIYAANKHAVVGLARSLGPSLALEGIRFNAVCPGFAESAMTAPIRAGLRPPASR